MQQTRQQRQHVIAESASNLPDDPDSGHNVDTDNNAVVRHGPRHPEFENACGIGLNPNVVTHHLGDMSVICPNCSALHWIDERLQSSTKRLPKFGSCCLQGKIKLFEIQPPPNDPLKLFNGIHHDSKHFLDHIWNYNLTFSMTSLGVIRISHIEMAMALIFSKFVANYSITLDHYYLKTILASSNFHSCG